MDTKLPKALRNYSETLLAMFNHVVNHSELIPFGPTPNGIPNLLSESSLVLRTERPDGKLAGKWAEEHATSSILSLFLIGGTLFALVCPGPVYMAFLAALGFGPEGVRALSLAAQGRCPNGVKEDLFAYLLNASMGRYGMYPFSTIFQSVVAGGTGRIFMWQFPKEHLPLVAKL
ncbi:hypothetical protein B0H65DRAFT_304014 [Neurospora tetraspora]|uniref:Uncharacterized protein n=1 Tax=Neurospora tetraspora TaxID=94610 RepID=A0AAE0MPB0_9PEZI|nr:hypothetical protein B0H65DRAFT_304014 [Neurospora tetraspora]